MTDNARNENDLINSKKLYAENEFIPISIFALKQLNKTRGEPIINNNISILLNSGKKIAFIPSKDVAITKNNAKMQIKNEILQKYNKIFLVFERL